jgi:Zn-dependent peptidase ImmA (M78 family)
MMTMIDPVAKAKWVLASKEITSIPAQSLCYIADSEGIKHSSKDYQQDDWDGSLIYKGKKRAIVVNTHRGNELRHNFTFAHELGHYFLEHEPTHSENGRLEMRCTPQDIAKGSKPIEVEANLFAAELLMPEDRFRLSMAGAGFDFALIKSLSVEYQISKEACAYRILEFICEPCAIIFTVDDVRVRSIKMSRPGRGVIPRLKEIPKGTLAHTVIKQNKWQKDFEECEFHLWMPKGQQEYPLFSLTRGNSDYAMTILRW